MIKTKRFILPLSFAILGIALLLLTVTTGRSIAAGELNRASLYNGSNLSAPDVAFPVLADFETGLPSGWFTFGGEHPSASVVDESGNMVLDVSFAVTSYGGLGANLDSPSLRDWSAYNAISFDFTGTNSGIEHKFQIQDAEGGGLERWFATFVDDSTTTKTVVLLFDDFEWNTSFQDGSASDDGLQVTDMAAWLFDFPQASATFQVDNIQVIDSASAQFVFPVVADFEAGVPAGWLTFGGEHPTTNVVDDSGNMVLDVSFAVTSYGGFGAIMSDTLGQRDWSSYNAISFDFTGTNSGTEYKFQIQDAEGGGLERWFATFVDDSTATKTVNLLFEDFEWNTSYQDGSAADDGLQVTDMEAWLFDLPVASGSFKLDNVEIINYTPPVANVGFADAIYRVVEGNPVEIAVSLTMTSTNAVTVTVNSADSQAKAGDDYTALVSEQVVVPAGQLSATLMLSTIDNSDYEMVETLSLALANADGVPIAMRTTTIVIEDDETPDPNGKAIIVDDFEDGLLPEGEHIYTLGGQTYTDTIGWIVWYGPATNPNVAITTTTSAPVAPNKTVTNTVLELKSTVNDWGGVTHAFENDAIDEWESQDWSDYAGFCFWYYGTGTGTKVLFELNENRLAYDAGDPNAQRGAEVWSYEHADFVAGWQFVQVPFSALVRKNINNGAPNDGWSGEEVHGWAVGSLHTLSGQETRYVDDFGLWGTAPIPPLSVQFGEIEYEVTEGDTLPVEIQLNQVYSMPVTVAYRTDESYAMPDRDFISISGTVVIPAGETSVSVDLVTIDDNKIEGTEALQLSVVSADNGAILGFSKRTIVKIVNNDANDPALLHDFEGWHPYDTTNATTSIVELAQADANAVPGQWNYEQVLSVVPTDTTATLLETFVEPQSWTNYGSMSFWYKGTGSGDTVTVGILDNAANSNATVTNTQWVEVWSQEFNDAAGTVPDSNVWSYELGDGKLNDLAGWGNDEFQYYTNDPANAQMDGNGNLVVTLDAMDGASEHCHYGYCTQSSARLISENKMEFKYGEIEARIQVPTGPAGLWPAFWMLGTDIREVGWPNSGEIDIMEYVSKLPNEIFGTLHGPGHFGGNAHGNTYNFAQPVANDYHTFRIIWEPDHVEWYVDDILYHTANSTDPEVGGNWVYNHPFYLILNLAIGGNFGGTIDAGMTYPQTMLVDYIRVKGAADSAERFEASFVDDSTDWKKVTIPFSDFTRSATQPTGAPNDGLNLTEVNGYSFEVTEATRSVAGSFMLDRVYLEQYRYYLPIIMK